MDAEESDYTDDDDQFSIDFNESQTIDDDKNLSVSKNYPFIEEFEINLIEKTERLQIRKILGSGSFGSVYLASCLSNYKNVAVKIELLGRNCEIFREHYCYKVLQGVKGIPKVYWSGCIGLSRVLIIDLLGPSLCDLHTKCNRRFSLKTTLMLIDQLLETIESVHDCLIIHRDIKPSNCVMGLNQNRSKLYIIDFGIAIDCHESAYEQMNGQNSFCGTLQFSSRNALQCKPQSQRDDLESIGYTMLYLMNQTLPWSDYSDIETILDSKLNTSVEEMCCGLPNEFSQYFNYCYLLNFLEKPNYTYLKSIFRGLFRAHGYQSDYIYDWTRKIYS
ncbi:hypothetical protein HELRODRAFT_79049 [Helobdella robusta]|uniref:non-specific serine/threonine protein kinase n=1 Tax=Helobdella robusta TaxID=6412 RepID=T1G3J3_HELRO|nr:hypothetical protein HELRODRAFT_79049 [Helobdella robusta]ESO04532.1 hypothetical protein HELRODRAFT_79049 [Helobdella robusta]